METPRETTRVGEDIHPEINAGNYARRTVEALGRRKNTGQQVIIDIPTQLATLYHLPELAKYIRENQDPSIGLITKKSGEVTRSANWNGDFYRSEVIWNDSRGEHKSGVAFFLRGDRVQNIHFFLDKYSININTDQKADGFYRINGVPFRVIEISGGKIGITVSEEEQKIIARRSHGGSTL